MPRKTFLSWESAILGAEELQRPQGKKNFQDGKENNGWKNVCLLPVLPTATYIRARARAETGCPAQTRHQEFMLVGMMTETMWEPQGSGPVTQSRKENRVVCGD